MVWDFVIGGGLTLVGLILGHFQGYLMGTKVKNLSSLLITPSDLEAHKPPPPPETIRDPDMCLCQHYRISHLSLKGRCVVTTKEDLKTGLRCACQGFVGKIIKPVDPPKGELEL